jgi:hypothetical protein
VSHNTEKMSRLTPISRAVTASTQIGAPIAQATNAGTNPNVA